MLLFVGNILDPWLAVDGAMILIQNFESACLPASMLKLNVNGAVFNETRKGRVGVVVRDEFG